MSKLTRRWVVIVTLATLLAGPSVARAHGHGGGFHGGHGGFHHGWGGWGYPALGFGLGLGLGYGLGYGGGYGWGYPYYGWGGYPYGYGGSPYRYGYVAPYGYGVGSPYGYGPSGWYGASAPAATSAAPAMYATNTPVPAPMTSPATSTFVAAKPAPAAPAPFAPPAPGKLAQRLPTSPEFAKRGDMAFQRGDYAAAAVAWQHALVDEPGNGTLALKIGQAKFALGKYDEAASAVEQGMSSLPSTHWGAVIRERAQLYGSHAGNYMTQLRGLERAVQDRKDESAGSPAQFLLAYQYAFSGRPSDAAELLRKISPEAPQHAVAGALHDTLDAKFAAPDPQPRSARPATYGKPVIAQADKPLDL